MAAGIFAAEANPEARIAVFDGAAKVGAKILVAGGGRCNVTHHRVDARDYNAATRNLVKNVLASFTADDTVRWLADMGVTLKREPTGKLFPTPPTRPARCSTPCSGDSKNAASRC